MFFCKATAVLIDEKWIEDNNDRRIEREHIRQIATKTYDYNQKRKDCGYTFVVDFEHEQIICGMIASDCRDTEKDICSFLRAIGMKVRDLGTKEITLSELSNMLSRADACDYISDDTEVLERFDLDRIRSRHCGIEYGENLIESCTDKKEQYAAAKKLLATETLLPELDRIYSGKIKSVATGHPVHYFVRTDDRETRKRLYGTLLKALYNAGRIKSRRYCYLDFRPGDRFSATAYDFLYKSCECGAVVVRYLAGDDSEDHEYANGEMETIATLCETMMKYRNRVLTVFCLPRACEKVKTLFFENLGSIGTVEIKEDLADAEKSVGYLRLLCKEQHIRPDKKLFSRLEADGTYLPDELRRMFEDWYNNKMKTVIFPQYRDIAVCREEATKKVARGTAYDDLQGMIGLNSAKEVIGKALDYYKLQRIYKDKGIKQDRPAMHMVFTGNPGTAKTTVARLFARIMKENGLLSKGHLVEVGRSDLVGKYVGWTAQIVKDKFKKAMGGVLFIDEAYSLVENREGLYGDEAINTIVQEMENRREDLVVIFAGYPKEMEEFLNKNPGLRSRIAFHVPFADYTAEELCLIAKHIGKSKGITITDKAITKLSALFETARQNDDFGNGRYVRNVIELSKMNQASRLIKMDPDKITEKELTVICEADIETPAVKTEPAKRKIGFGA